jgi:hypothetical protein
VVGQEIVMHLVVAVIIQQSPAQAQSLLHLEVEVLVHKQLLDQAQVVVVVAAKDLELQEHHGLEDLQHNLLSHKLCRPEVLLQIEDLVEAQVLDLGPVAVVVELEQLAVTHLQEELPVAELVVPVIFGH